ncbi:MAG: hypothetical protein LQ342_006815 [Letrouitia transgressa]|nr:MAG: hypothetical protein LQ342_006815 [Letrouitia transgressa]
MSSEPSRTPTASVDLALGRARSASPVLEHLKVARSDDIHFKDPRHWTPSGGYKQESRRFIRPAVFVERKQEEREKKRNAEWAKRKMRRNAIEPAAPFPPHITTAVNNMLASQFVSEDSAGRIDQEALAKHYLKVLNDPNQRAILGNAIEDVVRRRFESCQTMKVDMQQCLVQIGHRVGLRLENEENAFGDPHQKDMPPPPRSAAPMMQKLESEKRKNRELRSLKSDLENENKDAQKVAMQLRKERMRRVDYQTKLIIAKIEIKDLKSQKSDFLKKFKAYKAKKETEGSENFFLDLNMTKEKLKRDVKRLQATARHIDKLRKRAARAQQPKPAYTQLKGDEGLMDLLTFVVDGADEVGVFESVPETRLEREGLLLRSLKQFLKDEDGLLIKLV